MSRSNSSVFIALGSVVTTSTKDPPPPRSSHVTVDFPPSAVIVGSRKGIALRTPARHCRHWTGCSTSRAAAAELAVLHASVGMILSTERATETLAERTPLITHSHCLVLTHR